MIAEARLPCPPCHGAGVGQAGRVEAGPVAVVVATMNVEAQGGCARRRIARDETRSEGARSQEAPTDYSTPAPAPATTTTASAAIRWPRP
jgi:hypothetical protein